MFFLAYALVEQIASGIERFRPFQENESLFDGLKAAAEASTFGESVVCSGLRPSA
jgi:hypothetical protein